MTERAAARPAGLLAIDAEMARQHRDALASFAAVAAEAGRAAASLSRTGRLVLLGMGASHAAGRAVAPLYRGLGIDAVALPLSEQLAAPLPLAGRTVFVTSQSGESGEVAAWFRETGGPPDTFGLTLDAGSFLASAAPALVATGGPERAFAATRSLTLTLALHLAVLAALGEDPAAALAALEQPQGPDVAPALAALADVGGVVTSGRRLQGLAEALALGLTELARAPCFSLETGQLRHGPMEMLGPDLGVILFRAADATAGPVTDAAKAVAASGAPLVVFDAAGLPAVPGAAMLRFRPAGGLAALLAMLPAAQRLMIGFAAGRVANAGTPLRSTKITRTEQ